MWALYTSRDCAWRDRGYTAEASIRNASLSGKILASGHLPEFLYERGRLDTGMPFAELQRRSRINALALAADKAADFPPGASAGRRVPRP